MKNCIFKILAIALPIAVAISFCILGKNNLVVEDLSGIMPIENEYRLKFVDSVDYDIGLSSSFKAMAPVEIVGIEPSGEWIKVYTAENAVVVAPIQCKVVHRGADSITLQAGKITVDLKNIIVGTMVGNSLEIGQLVGTVCGDYCLIKVYYGERLLTAEEIEALL